MGAHAGNRSVLFKRLTVDNFTGRIFWVNLDFKKNQDGDSVCNVNERAGLEMALSFLFDTVSSLKKYSLFFCKIHASRYFNFYPA